MSKTKDIYSGWGFYLGRLCLLVEDRGNRVLLKFGADGPVETHPVEQFDPITDIERERLS